MLDSVLLVGTPNHWGNKHSEEIHRQYQVSLQLCNNYIKLTNKGSVTHNVILTFDCNFTHTQ